MNNNRLFHKKKKNNNNKRNRKGKINKFRRDSNEMPSIQQPAYVCFDFYKKTSK